MRPLATLRGRLFALLAILGAVTALAVGGATYFSVRTEADALFDYQLRQTALSLRDQGRVAGDEAAALADPSFDYVVQIWSVQGLELYSSRPQGMTEPLPARAVLGYSDLRLGGQAWRVYSAATPLRVVQVAQPLAVRQKLAALAALRSVVPVAVALPLVAAALWWLIGLSLAPLARVVQAAQSGGANALHALPTDGLPGEIAPLVEAFNGLLARLSTAFDTQRSFVADAAHELRTPLTALKLQLGLLRDSAPGPQQDEAIDRLRAGIDPHLQALNDAVATAEIKVGDNDNLSARAAGEWSGTDADMEREVEEAQAKYEPPRTPDGKPDLQGVWSTASLTTMMRGGNGDKVGDALVIPAEKVAEDVARGNVTPDLVPIAGGDFLMGNDGPDAVPGDGEGPVRRVHVDAFAIAPTTVTNRAFGDFVRATHYVTEAERNGASFVFYLQLPEAHEPHHLVDEVQQ